MVGFSGLAAVALGGALGACLRYFVSIGLSSTLNSGFPLGTLAANLTGCLLIGAAAALLPVEDGPRTTLRLFVVVGCLGGFTTFSSFGLETVQLLEEDRVREAVTYVLASNVGGLALCFLAWFVTGFSRR